MALSRDPNNDYSDPNPIGRHSNSGGRIPANASEVDTNLEDSKTGERAVGQVIAIRDTPDSSPTMPKLLSESQSRQPSLMLTVEVLIPKSADLRRKKGIMIQLVGNGGQRTVAGTN
jgi:hypothetical protein